MPKASCRRSRSELAPLDRGGDLGMVALQAGREVTGAVARDFQFYIVRLIGSG